MLLTKEVEITITPRTFKHYKELGYCFEHVGDKVVVNVCDLPRQSNTKLPACCDICGNGINIQYDRYTRVVEKCGYYSCNSCSYEKRKNTTFERYGVYYASQSDEIKSKIKNNNQKKYGVEHYFKTNDCKEKTKKSCLERYGVEYFSQAQEVRQKIQNTNLERYGNTCSLHSLENENKTKNTNLKKYGVEYPSQSPKIQEKISQSLYNNNSQKISTQQLYLHNLYGGEINYPIKQYNADICLTDEKIIIEYDGGGHMLNVITGRETLKEYNKKSLVRDKTIKREGYKQIRIISSKDYLPSDEILLQMLEQAKEYFNNTTHTWVEYNIDTSLMRNAENKEGVFFDYGNLRKIKKAS